MGAIYTPHLFRFHHQLIWAAIGIAVLFHLMLGWYWFNHIYEEEQATEVRIINLTVGEGGNIFVNKPNRTKSQPTTTEQTPSPERADTPLESKAPGTNQPAPATSPPSTLTSTNETPSNRYVRPKIEAGTMQKQRDQAIIMTRYEQMLSQWIIKHQEYPDYARSRSMEGQGIVRVRIDRKGNILYKWLEYSTGHTLLDRAILDMIERADPVPPVPADYPAGDMIEFRIPVSFHLN